MSEDTPKWAKELIKEVSDLKKQTLTNCNKLSSLDKKISKELPRLRVKIDTLCRSNNVIETNIHRIENKISKIEKKF